MTPRASGTAPLVYWLLVMCGLTGVTFLRLDEPTGLPPLWIGTILGVALGQIVAHLRVRLWVLGVLAMACAWVGPFAVFLAYGAFGSTTDTFLLAFFPAAICGYLSLSERAGLVAFWYPAVLWVVAILDGPKPGSFDARSSLPMLVGLAALFVAFLRARETRRAEIWRTHGMPRLATPVSRTVLRASPLRATSQLAWTAIVASFALVIAAWIAPHLWRKEHAKHEALRAARVASVAQREAAGGLPCCPRVPAEHDRARVREYLPLRANEEQTRDLSLVCMTCADESSATGEREIGGAGPSDEPATTATAATETAQADDWRPSPSPPAAAWDAPVLPVPPQPVAPQASPNPQPDAPATTPAPIAKAPDAPSAPIPTAIVLAPSAPPLDAGAPGRLALALCVSAMGLHVMMRALRRQLTLRHLTRPFWRETIDQRISNHWQRILIGLRDAGVRPGRDEQPLALARRVGIDGMSTCATILERVRHGVRVEESDLDEMGATATAVYDAARRRAGLPARLAAVLRWPLA
ncbi:MAG: hypothetical protein KF819_21595 [Labilithrix sp.]|nr:hypothetical protein [Labilithrix sp.]